MAAVAAGVIAIALTACGTDATDEGSGSDGADVQSTAQGTDAADDAGSADAGDDAVGSADADTERSTDPVPPPPPEDDDDQPSTETGSTPGSTESSSADEAPETGTSSADQEKVILDGQLDAEGAAWFGAMCQGIAPIGEALSAAIAILRGDDSTDLAQAQQQIAQAIRGATSTMESASSELASLPAPSLEHGADFATATVSGIAEVAKTLSGLADAVAAADVSSMADLQAVVNSSASGGVINPFGNFVPSNELRAQLKDLPGCENMGAMVG